jgi:hypothetical protein
MVDDTGEINNPSRPSQRVSDSESGGEVPPLWQIADEFRAWVIRDLKALPPNERLGFRGDYLFIIDGAPLFLVVVSPDTVSAARWNPDITSAGNSVLRADMGDPLELDPAALKVIADRQVRVSVQTDSLTLRRLLQGTLRAKVAYLGGLVKISGDLPCFMRLVAVLKGRGLGPRANSPVRT